MEINEIYQRAYYLANSKCDNNQELIKSLLLDIILYLKEHNNSLEE